MESEHQGDELDLETLEAQALAAWRAMDSRARERTQTAMHKLAQEHGGNLA